MTTNSSAYNHAYYVAHRERIMRMNNEARRFRRQCDPERARAEYRNWWVKNKEKAREVARNWKRNNPEYVKKYRAEWSKKNKAHVNAYHHRRYHTDLEFRLRFIARISKYRVNRRIAGSFTDSEWHALCKRHDYRCAHCRRRRKLTIDHIIPLSNGGTNFISNIQPLCHSCNSRKNNRSNEVALAEIMSKRKERKGVSVPFVGG